MVFGDEELGDVYLLLSCGWCDDFYLFLVDFVLSVRWCGVDFIIIVVFGCYEILVVNFIWSVVSVI